MRLDLSRFKAGEQRVDKTYEPAAFAVAGDEFRVVAPVARATDGRKDANQVRLVGTVKTTRACDCSRCLEAFAVPVDATFDLLYLPAGTTVAPASDDEEQELQADDVGVSFYKDDEIDLGDLVREQFYLALPMKPLCRPDCRGLCAVCGVNRNRETCNCSVAWIDPRLEGLKQFKRV